MTDHAVSPLVTTAWLAERLGDAALRLYDCTVHLRPDPPRTYRIDSGRADYEAAHIPGAAFLDLPGDLSDKASPLSFTMPAADAFAAALGAAGIGDDHTVVLYSSTTPMWATRVWWMLKASGREARVLDGGLPKWRAEGRATVAGSTCYPAATSTVRPVPARWADRAEVLASIGKGGVCTLNALPREIHTGEGGTNYGRKGHIKGSVNVPFPGIVGEHGTFKPVEQLRAAFAAVGALSAQRVICYCGGGISATMDAMALQLLGHPDIAVYDGSMSDWVRDPDLPMETGA